MYFSTPLILFVAMMTALGASSPSYASGETIVPACKTFRVYANATDPSPPKQGATLEECFAHYLEMDFDQDGIKDWTRAKGVRSNVLLPLDNDFDNDGIENLFDPEIYVKGADERSPASKEIPPHLKFKDDRAALQKKIFENFGVLPVDHTDRHSRSVLEALVTTLEKGLRISPREFQTIKVVYAFTGHDPDARIAAYHKESNAISIGGEEAWPSEKVLSENDRVRIYAAIAHEYGHAYLFEKISSADLVELSSKHGQWPRPKHEVTSLYEKHFFSPHPLRHRMKMPKAADPRLHIELAQWKDSNLVSQYASINVHEWFADAYAADVLQELLRKGEIKNEKSLEIVPERRSRYWSNYKNLDATFRQWFRSRSPASVPESAP